jgi:hypothetical protein
VATRARKREHGGYVIHPFDRSLNQSKAGSRPISIEKMNGEARLPQIESLICPYIQRDNSRDSSIALHGKISFHLLPKSLAANATDLTITRPEKSRPAGEFRKILKKQRGMMIVKKYYKWEKSH